MDLNGVIQRANDTVPSSECSQSCWEESYGNRRAPGTYRSPEEYGVAPSSLDWNETSLDSGAPCIVTRSQKKQPALAAQESTLRSPLEAWGWDSYRKCHLGLKLSWEYDRLCLCILQKACFPDSGGPSEVDLIRSTHLRTRSGSFAKQNLPLAKTAAFLCV